MRRSETIGGGSRLMLSFPAHLAPGDASCPDPKGLEHGVAGATGKLHSTRPVSGGTLVARHPSVARLYPA